MVSANFENEAAWLDYLTWPEVDRYLTHDSRLLVAFGSTEQHGPHLPLCTDSVVATEVAARTAARTGTLITAPLRVGISAHHAAFPGTTSASGGALLKITTELLIAWVEAGFRDLFLVNAHGANNALLELAATDCLQSDPRGRIRLLYVWSLPRVRDYVEREFGISEGLHAGPGETSVISFLRPELTRASEDSGLRPPPPYWLAARTARQLYPNGTWGGRATTASSEHGSAIVALAIDDVAALVDKALRDTGDRDRERGR